MHKENIRTKQQAMLAASGYVEVYGAGEVQSRMGLLCLTQAINVCIGPDAASASDATAFTVPALAWFEIDTGITGVVSVKPAADATIQAYSA